MPGPGSLLNFALAVTDNDEEVSKQVSYAYLRTRKTSTSPWVGVKGLEVRHQIEPKWSLFPW